MPGTYEHLQIEDWYMNRYIANPRIAHVEYYIPVYKSLRRADIVNSQSGEVFEIKSLPIILGGGGGIDLAINVAGMQLSASLGLLHGSIGGPVYGMNQYNWNNVRNWNPGTGFPAKTPPIAIKGNWVLYAGLVSSGLIAYWYEPLGSQTAPYTIPVYPPIPAQWRQQAGYVPALVSVPAPAYTSLPQLPPIPQEVILVGGVVVLVVAGSILILTPGGQLAGATCLTVGLTGGTLMIYDEIYPYGNSIDPRS